MGESRILLVGLTACAAALVSAQKFSTQSYVDARGEAKEYSVPTYAKSSAITTSTLADGRQEIKFTFSKAFSPETDKILIQAFFDSDPNTPTVFDRVVVAAFGNYTYPSAPRVAPDAAAVANVSDHTLVGLAESVILGNTVSIRFAPSLVAGTSHNLIRLFWLPASVPETELSGGLNGIQAFRLFQSPATFGKFWTLPRVPIETIEYPLPIGRAIHRG